MAQGAKKVQPRVYQGLFPPPGRALVGAVRQSGRQNGYAAFSVSESTLEAVAQSDQETHHKTITFQDEYRAFLKRHNVSFDERYVWD